MRRFLQEVSRHWARSGTQQAGAQQEPVRRLQCESLEDRMLLSLTGGEFLVNSTLSRVQHSAVSASSSNGRSVVVWVEEKSSTDADIKAQIYDAAGRKVGKEIQVTNTKERESEPTVAMDSKGNFVVAWTYDFLPGDKDVRAARFSSTGARLGSEFRVAYSYKSEYAPSIAMASNGDYVISYTYQFNSTDTDIYARQFKATGTLVRTIQVAVSSRPEYDSQVAATPDGRFGVAYGMGNDIYLKRYTSVGGVRGTDKVAATTRTEISPTVSVDTSGDFVVAWQEMVGSNANIMARRVSNYGQLGSVTSIATTSASETVPSVALDPTKDSYVVAYQVGSGSTSQVKVSEVSASNKVTSTATVGSNLNTPSVSISATHRYFVTAQSYRRRLTDPDGGVFGRFGTL